LRDDALSVVRPSLVSEEAAGEVEVAGSASLQLATSIAVDSTSAPNASRFMVVVLPWFGERPTATSAAGVGEVVCRRHLTSS